MINRRRINIILIFLVLLFSGSIVLAQTTEEMQLPSPQMEGGKPLLQALKERQSNRAFLKDKLPLQVLSNLLWAADGINRPDSKKRTAPSARNVQDIDIYVVMEEGVYLYDAAANSLKLVVKSDLPATTGAQEFVKEAPINLVYVADLAKYTKASDEDKTLYSNVDAGVIVQNVYLFCASEGLATVVRGMVDRSTLAAKIGLRPEQKIIVAQTIGYPAK